MGIRMKMKKDNREVELLNALKRGKIGVRVGYFPADEKTHEYTNIIKNSIFRRLT